MFSGGVFFFSAGSNDTFVCADGIEMTRTELVNITRAVKLLLQKQAPLEGMRVQLVEAATTLVYPFKGHIFGVSTYQPMAIPFLSSTLDRVLSCVLHIFGTGDLDSTNQQMRSQFYTAMKALLTDSPSAEVTRDIRQSFNIPCDIGINVGTSRIMEPHASGDFQTVTAPSVPEEISSSGRGEESNTETSVAEICHSGEPQQKEESDPQPAVTEEAAAQRGTVSVKLTERVTFKVRDNTTAEDISCECELDVHSNGSAECGHLQFAVIPATMVKNSKVNRNVITEGEDGIYTCTNPTELLSEETKVLLFESNIPDEPVPFTVHCKYAKVYDRGAIRVEIKSQYAMAEIFVGIDATGLENPTCETNDLVVVGDNILVKMDPKADSDESVSAVIIGNVDDSYTPPRIVQVKCLLRGTSFGGLTVKTHPSGMYDVDNIVRDIDVTRSFWVFRE